MNKLCLQIIILAAFWCQSLIPAGYMPSFSKDGQTSIVICSIEGQKTVSVSADNLPIPTDEQHDVQGGETCPYSISVYKDILHALDRVASSIKGYKFSYHALINHFDFIKLISVYNARAPPIFS